VGETFISIKKLRVNHYTFLGLPRLFNALALAADVAAATL
jgi:hypothetical protein